MQNKPELRRTLLALRNTMDPVRKTAFDRLIAARILAWWETARPKIIGVYSPMRGEPDLQEIYAALHEKDVQLALPMVVSDDAPLKFVTWTPGETLTRDRFGAYSPSASNPEVFPHALIIPCLGFNQGCFRLGYGGGFYDRTLVIAPRPSTIGVAYAASRADFAADTFDIALDSVITEADIFHA